VTPAGAGTDSRPVHRHDPSDDPPNRHRRDRADSTPEDQAEGGESGALSVYDADGNLQELGTSEGPPPSFDVTA
jgi:hypothetical protein